MGVVSIPVAWHIIGDSRMLKYAFSRMLDMLPDWDIVTDFIVAYIPESWCDQAD
jgi:hypothetical protein